MGLFRRNKNNKKPLIRQIIDLVPRWLFDSCTSTYQTDKGCSKYKTYDQFVALTFGQLNKCQSLNDISAGIGVSEVFIEDLNLRQSTARSTMSDGNKKRNWQVFESMYYRLLSHYKAVLKKHHNTHIIKEIEGKSVKLIDSTVISLSPEPLVSRKLVYREVSSEGSETTNSGTDEQNWSVAEIADTDKKQ